MSAQHPSDLEAALARQEALQHIEDAYHAPSVSLESDGDSQLYLNFRRWQEIEQSLGMEGLSFQTVKDAMAAAGRMAVTMGQGFMSFLDAIHRTIDRTHLVRVDQLRTKIRKLDAEEARLYKGRMERKKLAGALAIGGQVPENLSGPVQALTNLSAHVRTSVLPELASLNRQVGNRLNSKRAMGMDVFADEVEGLVKIIGSSKLPMDLYPEKEYQRLHPGNRSIFSTYKPKRPRKMPQAVSGPTRKLIEGVSETTVGLRGRPDHARGKADAILPILTMEKALVVLDLAEALLKEALRVKEASKSFGKDRMPSTMSLLLSGFAHGVKKQIDDIWTAQDDGFDVIEGAHQGGTVVRHKPGTRNMFGGLTRAGETLGVGVESARDDDEERFVLAAWVVRYLKLPLIDQQKTSQALILLLVGVARTYIEYVEESYDYYT